MLNEFVLKYGILLIAFLSFVVNLAINREKLQQSKLKVEILNDAFKVNYRTTQILDFQIGIRLQATNQNVCLRRIILKCKNGIFSSQESEAFEKAVNIRGDLTKYNEDDFFEFMHCVVAGYDCSKILEYESRFREFIHLRDVIVEKDVPRPITLLGRIPNYQITCKFFLLFEYDLNGSRRMLSKKLEFNKFMKQT